VLGRARVALMPSTPLLHLPAPVYTNTATVVAGAGIYYNAVASVFGLLFG